MNILLSNDDGFLAPGINLLRKALMETHHVITVAPDRDRSGASNSLTLENPLRLTRQSVDFYSLNGTPTDCVHLALTGLYTDPPDIVISGINAGANLGDDVLYSGTVAAAMEGRYLGYPSIAVSMAHHQPKYFETAVQAVLALLPKIPDYPEDCMILNVNVPDLPWAQIKGFQVTRLGQRHRAEPVIHLQDPRGRDIYWIGPPGKEQDAGEGTDFYAVRNGYISITPLHSDLTRHRALVGTEQWLNT
ncbi:5'/3'-nucleotidase SurE [Thiofilum flexile]|uniref:5'/3'-nucleotidase SurE n=1 Tax=Thiofilum flexile TaxID=125627 RepID=UPI000375866F|nr:5'/3'-nucleotidase SurE [Thiofilum flexile]